MTMLRLLMRSVVRGDLRTMLRNNSVLYQVIVNADNGTGNRDNPFNWFVDQTS